MFHPLETEKMPLRWYVKGNRFFVVWNRLEGFDFVSRLQLAFMSRDPDWLRTKDILEDDILDITNDVIRLRDLTLR